MGWLQWVGALKLQVSFGEYSLFYRSLLQKRPIILRSLLIEAIPYCYQGHPKWHLKIQAAHVHTHTRTHSLSLFLSLFFVSLTHIHRHTISLFVSNTPNCGCLPGKSQKAPYTTGGACTHIHTHTLSLSRSLFLSSLSHIHTLSLLLPDTHTYEHLPGKSQKAPYTADGAHAHTHTHTLSLSLSLSFILSSLSHTHTLSLLYSDTHTCGRLPGKSQKAPYTTGGACTRGSNAAGLTSTTWIRWVDYIRGCGLDSCCRCRLD